MLNELLNVQDIIQSRHELLQLFDGLSDPIIMIDRQFVIQRVNSATLLALGKKSFDEFIEKPCYEMLHGLRQRCPQCTAPLTFSSDSPGQKTVRTGFMEAKENPLKTTYNITCYPLINDEGEITSIAEYYRDSSDIVNLSRELYESERARIMESLAVGLAHQIRQPLTIIRSAAQYGLDTFTAKDNSAKKDLRETMESIVQNVDTVNDVLNDLLLFSKPTQYKMKKGSVVKLLQQGLRLVRQLTKEQQISVATDWSQDLPEILIDERLLLQACLNLLMNSIESMTKGGQLTVKAFCQENTTPPKVCIAIEDTGVGIPKELISKLCQPFFTTKEGGSAWACLLLKESLGRTAADCTLKVGKLVERQL
ncbi:MAG: histidine kinase dimerization/phospho-acceptor domain-containing protein [Candidatus Eisenbacteria bacterium]|nr:histidine kinase dimerization/phospho-acceptor domain-containing protein [Candidatus Eisenbacteria bacterium]